MGHTDCIIVTPFCLVIDSFMLFAKFTTTGLSVCPTAVL